MTTLHSLKARQQVTATDISTCGYLDGIKSIPRVANPGYHCVYDATFALFGFCTNTVSNIKNCGLMGRCTDAYACTAGCGRAAGVPQESQIQCKGTSTCFTDIVNVNSQSYSYIGCGSQGRDGSTYFALPTSVSASATSSSSSSGITAKPSPIGAQVSSSKSTSTSMSSSSATVTAAAQGGANVGAIFGGVIGGFVILCLTAAVIAYLVIRKKQKVKFVDSNWANSRAPPRSSPAMSSFDRAPRTSSGMYWNDTPPVMMTDFGESNRSGSGNQKGATASVRMI